MARVCFIGAWLAIAALATCSSAAGGAAAPGAAGRSLLASGRRLAAGANETGVQAAVAFGTAAKRGDFPWVAILGEFYLGGECIATLIRPRVLVTTARCVNSGNIYSAKLNRIIAQKDGIEILADGVITHPKFNEDTLAYDIGLIMLASPATITPVKLAPASLKLREGEPLTFAGFGMTQRQDYTMGKLTYAVAPVLATATCNKQLASFKIPATHFCAGLGKNRASPCLWDVGAPLVKGMGKGATLVGIVSHKSSPNYKCGQATNNFNGYTSIMAMRPWLDAQFKALKV